MDALRTAAARWRALLAQLWRASRLRLALFGALVLAAGLLPTAAIVLTGALAAAIPAAARQGLGSPGGHAALLALGGLVAVLAAQQLGGQWLWLVGRAVDADYLLEVHHTVARVALGAPGVALLEDPAFAAELQAVSVAEGRGIVQRTASNLAYVAQQRLRGAGAFIILLGFAWWAPLPLAAAWQLTNLAYLRATRRGMEEEAGEGGGGMRRGEYLRALAMEPAAAKEIRVFGAGPWVVARYTEAWGQSLHALWQSRRSSRALDAASVAALVVAHAAVLGALGAAAARGQLGVAALLVFVQAAIATADLGLVGDLQWYLSHSLRLAHRLERLAGRARLLPAAPSPRPPPASGPVGVRLDGVRFTYPGRSEPTLDGLTLHVLPGQSLAVVGENGAG
ncbi:MAG TPA: hypothetical protein VFJ82_02580, partial [Longimicrobium sp.]|nr:hypothetical protein [Longimicrobium sp.]